jgi:hypothetical protein
MQQTWDFLSHAQEVIIHLPKFILYSDHILRLSARIVRLETGKPHDPQRSESYSRTR